MVILTIRAGISMVIYAIAWLFLTIGAGFSQLAELAAGEKLMKEWRKYE